MTELNQTIGQCLQESLITNIQAYVDSMAHARLQNDYVDHVEKELIKRVTVSCNLMRHKIKIMHEEIIKKDKGVKEEQEKTKARTIKLDCLQSPPRLIDIQSALSYYNSHPYSEIVKKWLTKLYNNFSYKYFDENNYSMTIEDINNIIYAFGDNINSPFKRVRRQRRKDKAEYLYPMHVIAMYGNLEVIQYAIEKGANVNIKASNLSKQDMQRHQPIHFLCKRFGKATTGYYSRIYDKNNNYENKLMPIVEFMLSNGASLTTKDNNGNTGLYYLARFLSEPMLNKLIDMLEISPNACAKAYAKACAKACITIENHGGFTMVYVLAKRGYQTLLKRIESEFDYEENHDGIFVNESF